MSIENSKLTDIKLGLVLLFKPGQLVEFRVKTAEDVWRGFYGTDHDRLAEIIARLDDDPRVVSLYVVINPVKNSLLRERAKCNCKVCALGGLLVDNPTDEQVEQILTGPTQHLTKNEDIDTLQNLFIDIDTTRASRLKLDEATKPEFERLQHESSTKDEKKETLQVANKVLVYLEEIGWPQPLIADSGNGYHILPRVNSLNSIHNANLLLDCLKALANRFNCDACHIDASVFNPARLTRAYGTTTRKGTNTEERPYRRNRLMQPDKPILEVSSDQIMTLANEVPTENRRRNQGDSMPVPDPSFDPEDYFEWFKEHPNTEGEIAFDIVGTREAGGVIYKITDTCLIAGHRHEGSDVTGFAIGKSFGYHCFSSDCEGITLRDIHEKLLDRGFELYPYPIFVNDGLETILDGVAEGWIVEADEAEQVKTKAETVELDKAMEPAPVEEPGKPNKGVWSSGSEALDGLDTKCNDLAAYLMGIIVYHNEEVWQDGFIYYVKRIKIKLGYDKKWEKPVDGEAPQQTLKLATGETLRMIVKFTEAHKRLPDKLTLKHFIDVSTDPYIRKHEYKTEMKEFIDALPEYPVSTFDITAIAFLDTLDLRAEISAVRTVFNYHLLKQEDIVGARTALKKHFNASTTQDTNFEQGSWQERTEAIYADFEKNIKGVGDERKFTLGFPSIDNSGMNIGLDGDRAICLCGPASNRKTTFALSLAMNFAIGGKNGLFFAGEHQCMKVLKRLTLQLSHFFRDDPEIGKIPGLSKWEGLHPTATEENLKSIKNLLLKLHSDEWVSGYLEPQNIGAVTRGDDDKLGAILQYAEATYPKYQWDFIVIDPLDSIMPPEVIGAKGASNWKLCSGIVDRLFDFSRNAFNGRGCMVVVTAQFGTDARREIEKIQEKNAGMENYDDELESILKRDGLIQYFTTIGQRFDLALGLAARTKDGSEGMIVRGRDREGGTFNSCAFHVDPDTNYMTEKKRDYVKLDKISATEAAGASATMGGSFDEAL